MEEEWKDIPGYEEIYQASNTGKIKSLPRMCGQFHKEPGKILVTTIKNNGYPHVVLCKDGRKKNFTVHGLVALTFIGLRPEGQEVMHLDGNKRNPESTNLRYGSKSCNNAFTVDHGTNRTNGRKLDNYKANRIREYLSVGITGAELARHFGVGETTITNIRDNKNYKNISI
ncbi:MAG: NUMOD4 domain-containing protein [Desulfatirhabdiaceae bacterium]